VRGASPPFRGGEFCVIPLSHAKPQAHPRNHFSKTFVYVLRK
jgi:hypothetical protein